VDRVSEIIGKKYFLLSITIFALFFLCSAAITSASITCSSCAVNNCDCTISDCSNGKFRVYSNQDCAAPFTFDLSFSSGKVNWKPEATGTYYAQAMCDDGITITTCTQLTVSSGSPTTTTTSGGDGGGGGGGGTTTTTSIGGGTSGCRKEGQLCTAASNCCAGLYCDFYPESSGGICIKLSQTTTITSPSTSLEECPYECCVGDYLFYDKFCDSGYECEGSTCKKIKTETDDNNGGGWNFIFVDFVIYIVIGLVGVAIVYFVIQYINKSKSKTDWKALNKKWGRKHL